MGDSWTPYGKGADGHARQAAAQAKSGRRSKHGIRHKLKGAVPTVGGSLVSNQPTNKDK